MVAVNSRRKMYSVLRGAFSEDGIVEYVRELIGGRGRTTPLKGDLPLVADSESWDGKDGQVKCLEHDAGIISISPCRVVQVPVEDDYDLSDFDMDSDKDEL